MSGKPIPEAVRAQAVAWFAEYDKANHFPEMLATDAYAAGYAAAQQQGQVAPPSAPVGVEASYHPCTSILIEGLKRLEGGSDVLAEWDRARAKADTALAQQPAAVNGARGVVDVYTMQTIADAAAALDKRGDRQMAARLIRLHTRLLATQHQEPKP